jgi:hypothetical protein
LASICSDPGLVSFPGYRGVVGIKAFEQRLEGAVEGMFSRMFRSGLRPVELGRKLTREMDSGRSVGVNGQLVSPNAFSFALSTEDAERFADVQDSLIAELAEAAREHARDEAYSFMGPIGIDFDRDESLRTGVFRVSGKMRAGAGGSGAGSLILPTGERVLLGEFRLSFGRLPQCTVTLADQNASRTHAEVFPRGTSFVLADLGSTNGTYVNEVRSVEHELRDGDMIRIGSTEFRFEAS